MEIETKDLKELAVLVNKTMHSIEFPEDHRFLNYAGKTLRLLDTMDSKYQSNTTLRSVREAITSIPEGKLAFYEAARDLISQVNAPDGKRKYPSNVEFTLTVPRASVIPLRMTA